MFEKRKKLYFAIIIPFLLFIFVLVSYAIEIEIKPVIEGKEYFIMKVGETQTFEASGFGWDAKAQQKVPEAKIEAVQWSFDSRFLELIETKDNIITLKAIKDRTSKLTATGKVENEDVTKSIFVVIKKNEEQVAK